MITTPLLSILKTRLKQKYRTMAYPEGEPPLLPDRFKGKPVLKEGSSAGGEDPWIRSCPTGALKSEGGELNLDMGLCLFCGSCADSCPGQLVRFTADYRLAAGHREELIVRPGELKEPLPVLNKVGTLFKRSLKLRQVSAGGCNACEADCNVLSTVAWDMGRFGIQFVASPRHADGILVTGPVTINMEEGLMKTYNAVPEPKVVIAVGSCAISGGPFRDHPQQRNGVSTLLPVDLYIPGCPPHPLTILEGLLRFLGRV